MPAETLSVRAKIAFTTAEAMLAVHYEQRSSAHGPEFDWQALH
jgi:hypothetical protein